MYDNLIVPFDGSLPGRAVLAPTKDLAWRCDARVVVVSNTDASERSSRKALKGKAMSLSSNEVDFWIDHERSLGDAVLAAAEYRDDPLICVAVRPRGGIVQRKITLDLVAAQVLVHATVPVMVIGPKADVTLGLPLQELVVSLDGSPESELILPLAVRWGNELKLKVTLIGVSHKPAATAAAERRYLGDQLGRIAGDLPNANHRLLEGTNPGDAICAYLAERTDSVMMMSTHGRSGIDEEPLGSVAQAVMLKSPRPVVFRRAVPPEPTPSKTEREVWLNLPD